MNEMVDRLAAVLAKAFGDDWDICLKAPGLRKAGMYRTIARSMIVAMRAPTKAMVEAGNTALENATDSDWDSGGDGESHNSYTTIRSTAPFEIFQAMLDEALK